MTDLRALVERFGSPLYVYELDDVTQRWRDLQAALPTPNRTYYSLKANPHPALVAHLRELGALAEVSSAGELDVALNAGHPGKNLLVTGPAKSTPLISAAIDAGCRSFSVESEVDVCRIGATASRSGVIVDGLLRINIDRPLSRVGLSFGGQSSQFGIDLSTAVRVLSDLQRHAAVRICGLHFFLATNVLDQATILANFASAVAATDEMRAAGLHLEVVDLGGGFGAPYGRRGDPPSLIGIERELRDLVSDAFPNWRLAQPELWFESGRYLVGSSGTLVCRVVEVKRSKGDRFVIVDSGVHHLGGMAGLRRLPPLALEVQAPDGQPVTASTRVVGPLCTTLDTWALEAELPDVVPGDVVAVPNVGAYGLTASLVAFLSHELPTEIVLRSGDVVSSSRLEISRRAHP